MEKGSYRLNRSGGSDAKASFPVKWYAIPPRARQLSTFSIRLAMSNAPLRSDTSPNRCSAMSHRSLLSRVFSSHAYVSDAGSGMLECPRLAEGVEKGL